MFLGRRRPWGCLIVVPLLVLVYCLYAFRDQSPSFAAVIPPDAEGDDPRFLWRTLPQHFPVESMRPLPEGTPLTLPAVQAEFGEESLPAQHVRLRRQNAVKAAFVRCWRSYRDYAWGRDELKPVSGGASDPFGGWGATLVDSLDTLWIMGLRDDFEEAVVAAERIDFSTTVLDQVNVFETTIRYLAGFLGAYDLSGDWRLLRKAREVGDMLYAAFDTPNRMPVTRWNMNRSAAGEEQYVESGVLLAEIGSLCMEFTRLSLLTDDPKWFDASQQVMEALQKQQQATYLPGMWPVLVNPRTEQFGGYSMYTLGAMADSAYEYLPKMYAMVGGLLPMYRDMYNQSMETAMRHILFRPMLPDGNDILMSGIANARMEDGEIVVDLDPTGQHLVCFAGGMFALGGRLLQDERHMEKAHKLVDGCIWAYKAIPLGIMPESFYVVPCESQEYCPWDEHRWKRDVLDRAEMKYETDLAKADKLVKEARIPRGFSAIPDRRYILRPEAIESIFVLYRLTGRADLPDTAWAMFEAIQKHTRTRLANSAIWDVTATAAPPMNDSMESFWLGETLKYFYLMFSEPDLVSLDEYVFNTEAHPFKRLLPPEPEDT